MIEKDDFPTGARVRFNELGAARSPRMSRQFGTVVGVTGSGVRVILDGSRTVNKIHRSYLEVVSWEICLVSLPTSDRAEAGPVARQLVEPSRHLPDDTLIENVRIPVRIANALLTGFRMLGEIRETSDAGLITLPNMGKRSVKWLRENIG